MSLVRKLDEERMKSLAIGLGAGALAIALVRFLVAPEAAVLSVFTALLFTAVALGVYGLAARDRVLAFAGGGAALGLGLLALALALVPVGIAILFAARSVDADAHTRSIAVAAGGFAVVAATALLLGGGLAQAALDPCVEIEMRDPSGEESGSSASTPDGACPRGGTRYTSVFEITSGIVAAPVAGLAVLVGARRIQERLALAGTLALAALALAAIFLAEGVGAILAFPFMVAATFAAYAWARLGHVTSG